jgi:hypothetical protein
MNQRWSIPHLGQKFKRTAASALPTIEARLNECLVAVLFGVISCHSATSEPPYLPVKAANPLSSAIP